MGNKAYQQKMLKTTGQYSNLLNTIGFIDDNSTVIEIGCGTGVLTKMIAENSPKEIIGFEIDQEFYHPLFDNVGKVYNEVEILKRFKLYGEFSLNAFEKIVKVKDFSDYVLISNPPYDILPMVDEFIEKYGIKKVVLMIPERLIPHYSSLGYIIQFYLTGEDFEPSSTGHHYIITRKLN